MGNKGTIICEKCDKDIKWVKRIRNKGNMPIYEVFTYSDDESVVNNNGEVRCKNCDELNKIE